MHSVQRLILAGVFLIGLPATVAPAQSTFDTFFRPRGRAADRPRSRTRFSLGDGSFHLASSASTWRETRSRA